MAIFAARKAARLATKKDAVRKVAEKKVNQHPNACILLPVNVSVDTLYS